MTEHNKITKLAPYFNDDYLMAQRYFVPLLPTEIKDYIFEMKNTEEDYQRNKSMYDKTICELKYHSNNMRLMRPEDGMSWDYFWLYVDSLRKQIEDWRWNDNYDEDLEVFEQYFKTGINPECPDEFEWDFIDGEDNEAEWVRLNR